MNKESEKNNIRWSKYKHEYVVENIEESYLFSEQINKISNLILENSSKKDDNFFENEDKFNRLIGISGERGSGKSSLLKTLRVHLGKKIDPNYDNFYILPIIDPNKLDSRMGILETILSNLYLAVEKKRNEQHNPSNDFNEVSRKIVNQIGIVSKLAISKSDFRKHYSNEEILEQYHKQLLFEDHFHELFADVWSVLKGRSKEYYERGNLIVLIDDIDLVNNNLIFTMLDDIKKVLSSNVTTIITYRHNQLLNSIYDSKIKENERLLNLDFIDENEIRLQTSTYIEKMFMQNHIVRMPIKEEVIYLPLRKLFNSNNELELLTKEGFNENDSIIKNIYEVIQKKTLINMHSLDINERTLYESSFTLRGIVQMLEFLYEDLKNISNEYSSYQNFKTKLEMNLRKIKKYFLGVAEELLENSDKRVLEKWDLVDAQSKNYIIYKELYYQLNDKKSFLQGGKEINQEFDELLTINKVEAYNVCLGDVIEIINIYKDNTESNLSKYHFIYTIKIFYSIELLYSLVKEIFNGEKSDDNIRFDLKKDNGDYYFIEKDNNNDKFNEYWLTKYYQLTRYKIIPDSITWFSRQLNGMNMLYTTEIIDYIKHVENESSEDQNENQEADKDKIELKKKSEEKNFNESDFEKININTEEVLEFFDKVLYTSVSDRGDMRISRFKNKNLNSTSYLWRKDPHRFRYRHYFLFRFNSDKKLHESDEIRNNELSSVREGSYYPFDPYSYLLKEKYLYNISKKYSYLFYSMFDIDIILTKNHDKKNNTRYIDVLDSVNIIVSKTLSNDYNLANFLNTNKIKNDEIYNKKDTEIIEAIFKKMSIVLTDLEIQLLTYDSEKKLSGGNVSRKKEFIEYATLELEKKGVIPSTYREFLEILENMKNKKMSVPTKAEREAMEFIIKRIKNKKRRSNFLDE